MRVLACVVLVLGACSQPMTVVPTVDGGAAEQVDAGLDAGFDAGTPVVCRGTVSPTAGPCMCAADCPMGASCATETETALPGGFCLEGCDPNMPPDAGLVRCATVAGGSAALVAGCTATEHCREGWACLVQASTQLGICQSLCSRDAHCPTVGSCDLYTGQCMAEASTLAGLNQVCTRDEQCRSGLCYPATGATPGFCLTNCNLRDANCPESGTCISISSNPAYTMGLCVLRCVNGACAAGFRCTVNNNCLPIF